MHYSRGGVKLAGNDAGAIYRLMVFNRAACNDNQSLVAGGVREVAIVYKLSSGLGCLEI